MQSASDVQEWIAALAQYQAPTQTGVVADRGGSIATHTAGRYPLRPGDGRGDRILEGSTSESDWTVDLSLAGKPTVVDPDQGFLASANQRPVDPRASDVYLGPGWVEPWRAMRINEFLRASEDLTVDDFQRFQTDTRDVSSDVFVPAFLSAAERVQATGDAPAGLARAAELLAEWDGRWSATNTRTVLFALAMERLDDLIWDELDARNGEEIRRIWSPSASVTTRILDQPSSPWWDRGDTPDVVERRDDILARALHEALDTARERHGEEEGGGWQWERIQRTNIAHVGALPSLGALDLPGRGGPNTVQPSLANGRLGPAWRMVVALDDELQARAIYPGGQSGNPLSSRYRDRIDTWLRGDLEAVRFPRTPDDLDGEVSGVLTLDPGGS